MVTQPGDYRRLSAMSAAEQVEQTNVEALWLSYADSQKLSGLGRTTLWSLVSSGEIKAARVGRAVRISRRSLEEFMETRATQPRLPGFDDADQ
jgi:excisionase family DNA binding protein